VSVLVLLALIGGGLGLQLFVDRRRILADVRDHGWSELRIRWAPLARWLTSRRSQRWYRLRYLDPRGDERRCLCRVDGSGVLFEPPEPAESAMGLTGARTPAPRLARPAFVLVSALIGGALGLYLGIAACFVLYPGSNIAPAYGVILGAPLGLVAGLAFGLLRRR